MKSKYWILLNMQMLRYWNPLFFHREKSGKGSRKNLAVGVGISVVVWQLTGIRRWEQRI